MHESINCAERILKNIEIMKDRFLFIIEMSHIRIMKNYRGIFTLKPSVVKLILYFSGKILLCMQPSDSHDFPFNCEKQNDQFSFFETLKKDN